MHDTYAGTSILLNDMLKSEKIQQHIRNEPKEQAATMIYETRKAHTHKTGYSISKSKHIKSYLKDNNRKRVDT